ncbi:hypothetical protein HDU76_000557 [Blyttiomyces sp. JEL0837]|nr:hypothetical protein HDU76_000557 [Blyttiomyces sp. JEL0837]
MDVLKSYSRIDATKLSKDSHFVHELKLDRLDTTTVALLIEDEFNIEFNEEDFDDLASPRVAADKLIPAMFARRLVSAVPVLLRTATATAIRQTPRISSITAASTTSSISRFAPSASSTWGVRAYSGHRDPLTKKDVELRVLQVLKDFDKVDVNKFNGSDRIQLHSHRQQSSDGNKDVRVGLRDFKGLINI